MKRSPVGLDAIADWHNLSAAFHRAALGKRSRPEVQHFAAHLEPELVRLRRDILAGTVAVGKARRFRIHDPKPRLIHAPCFRERVLHHALMAHVGPVLDRALIDDTYACRVGKGTLAAVHRAQHHTRRWPWWAKIDIRAYFASIDHQILKGLLACRFKDAGLLQLMGRIIDAHADTPGTGLPIGALTSQQFANFYLAGLDRRLLEGCRVRGYVRYMDDIVWWGDDREMVRVALAEARAFAAERLALRVKEPTQVGRSALGLSLCGYRIFPGCLRLSRRRKRRYAECRRQWEAAYAAGLIDICALQAGYASALAITWHADAAAWRREQLRRVPLAPALVER
ncbi:RNA-dependent DNA polymerase [Marichromatium gracile]|uniref:reverse transcriptase domain-containing protein n=1 Tax=Marichromatium gracile TaxID=1048 RepID=UPI001EFF1C0F|nr:reverse transcriptase domain-containing protein [Marichromatium gracile]MCF1182036.1 RNA-dependent DNA polymerase [Marichromatium gracile]